jgi:hypothetical protein
MLGYLLAALAVSYFAAFSAIMARREAGETETGADQYIIEEL